MFLCECAVQVHLKSPDYVGVKNTAVAELYKCSSLCINIQSYSFSNRSDNFVFFEIKETNALKPWNASACKILNNIVHQPFE